MKTILIIWGIIFIITVVLVILFSKKEFKRLVSAETEKKQWRLMGDRTNYYRLSVGLSFIISGGLAYLIKLLFKL